ncbi:MAG: hypothetical protein DRI80_19825 [Chloroflexota bacterium]|nr:MAG: hypothetical protein DRI80_19825 [Chloroflexota bacterium]
MALEMVPELIPLNQLSTRIRDIRERLRRGPIVLTDNDIAAAVLVEPETWNDLLAELEDLQDALDALTAYEAYRRDPESVRPWQEVRAEL